MKKEVTVILGADHAGFNLKEKLKKYFQKRRIPYEDVGTDGSKPHDDYPDYAVKAAKKVAKNKNYKGILVCGTGTGMAMAANKVKGVRAVIAYDPYSAKMSRVDNNANVLGLRGRFFPFARVKKIVDIWLSTPFSKKPRHKRRLRKIEKIKP